LFLDGLASGPARSDSAGVVVTSGGQESSLNSGRVFELLLCDVGAKSAERFAGCWDAEFAPTVTNGVGPFRLKFLRIRHIRKVERLAPFRQRDPRIPQARIMFPLLGVVCFLRQRCAPGGRFPCGLAFGSHLFVSNVGPSDRYSGSCLHATSSRAHGASARRSDALRWLATGWSGLSGGPGFRISPSLASVVLCWLRSRQHP
jgi:hypothetical protein